jgi:hypothetical protein
MAIPHHGVTDREAGLERDEVDPFFTVKDDSNALTLETIRTRTDVRSVTVRPGTHLRSRWKTPWDQAHGTRASVAGMVVEDGVAVEG